MALFFPSSQLIGFSPSAARSSSRCSRRHTDGQRRARGGGSRLASVGRKPRGSGSREALGSAPVRADDTQRRPDRNRGDTDLAKHNCIGFRLLASGAVYECDLQDKGTDLRVAVAGSTRPESSELYWM